MEAAADVQDSVDTLQRKMHSEVAVSDAEANRRKDIIFSARRTAINSYIANGELPATFWAEALINVLRMSAGRDTYMPEFMGPYDEALLREFLQDFSIHYSDGRHRLTLHFKENPYFEETELWAECIEVHLPIRHLAEEDDEDEEDENEEIEEEDEEEPAPDEEDSWIFSGVTWKAGYGPPSDAESDCCEEQGRNADMGLNDPKKKRVRDAESGDGKSHRGHSVLEVFGVMPPHPMSDEMMRNEDEEGVREAVEEWEEEMADRRLLLRLMEFKVHYNPLPAVLESDLSPQITETDPKKLRRE